MHCAPVHAGVRRREVVAGVGALALLAGQARAQQTPVVGILSGTNREPRLIGAIQQGLTEAGYLEGRNVAFEYRFAEGRFERLPEMASELVGRGVAVIIGIQSANAPRAAKTASSTIPVVFSIGGDPVRLGLVESVSRPGGNVTGATFLVNTLAGKRLELLRELVPSAASVGVLMNSKNPAAEAEVIDIQTTAQRLGLDLDLQHAGTPAEIDAAFARFAELKIGAVTFAADATFNSRREQLVGLAARHAIPTIYFYRAFAEAGGLITYGGYDTDAYRIAGIYAGRILKGEKPADLPVQQSTRVELVINLKTARDLGLTIPPAILARADEVIE